MFLIRSLQLLKNQTEPLDSACGLQWDNLISQVFSMLTSLITSAIPQ